MKASIRNEWMAVAFLSPYFLFFLVFSILPIFYGLFVSFHDWTLIGKDQFVGFENYIYAFTDSDFWASLWHTTYFVILSVPLLIFVSFSLSLLLDANLRGRTFLRTAYFLPNILSVAVISYIWIFVLQPYSGLLNSLLMKIGLLAEGNEIFWLAEPNTAWISIVMITVWWTQGFNMIIFLAGLQSIPSEHYEAATIDGANAWQRLLFITLPAMRGLIALITVLTTIASFKVFGQVWLVTRGGPANATRTMIQYIYETGFRSNELGLATAMSFIFFIILLVLSILQFTFFSRKGDEAVS